MSASIHVSIVSHAQIALVVLLLSDIAHLRCISMHVTLTLNLDEPLPFTPDDYEFPLHILRNERPKGFGANHNAAFRNGAGNYPCEFFAILNPDIRLSSDVFGELLGTFECSSKIAAVAPLVRGPNGDVENTARRVPTVIGILSKALKGGRGNLDYTIDKEIIFPDWVGGMFILLKSCDFATIGGFDERYFLYYEDVDLSCRLRAAGFEIALNPKVSVVHEARRQSHRELRYLRWHLASMLRFIVSRLLYSIGFTTKTKN